MHHAGHRSGPAGALSEAGDVHILPPLGAADPTHSTLPAHGTDAAAVLAASPNAIVAVDQSGRITYANRQVAATFGYMPEDLIGRSIALLLPERARSRHRSHVKSAFSRPIARPMGIGLDLAGRHRDGRVFPVEISLVAVDTDSGVQVFSTVVDITARKVAEGALAESERRFRAVLEVSPNAVLSVDEAGMIRYVNPAVQQTFGYASRELVGKSVEILLPGGFDGRHSERRERLLRERTARPIGMGVELVGRHRGGREFPVEIGTTPVDTESGLQIFATIVDLSARKAAESELLHAQKLESVGRLAGGIAHDFNNILFAITGYSELLEGDLRVGAGANLDDTAMRSVKAIAEAAKRGASLTGQLLSFSRQQVVSAQILDLDATVRLLQPMLQPLIGSRIDLVLRLGAAGAKVMIDPGQFDQILVNLVVNARDAISDEGVITIETNRVQLNDQLDDPSLGRNGEVAEGHYAMISVSDNGAGMDEKTLQHAFEPFYTTKPPGKGTGLGLATSYGIVRQAGGEIWLYSEPGLGAVFQVYLPLTEGPLAATPNHLYAVTQPLIGGTALVVEDEPAVRDVTTRMLERAGYQVIAVSNGADALLAAAALDSPMDVLVTDAAMQGMSGIELAARVHELYPNAAVVILSGYTVKTLDLERAVAQGARFVAKPATSTALLAAVSAAVAERHEPRKRA